MMTLPGIDSFVPRRFLPAACAKMVKDPPRLHDSSVTNTRGSQTKDVCELHAPFRPRILPQLSVRALKKNRFCQNKKKNKSVFTVHILSTACRVYQPNALPKRIVCLEDGRHVKSIYSKVRCISSEKNKHFHICERPRRLLIQGDPGGMFPRKFLKFTESFWNHRKQVYFSPEKMFSNFHHHSVSFLHKNSHSQIRWKLCLLLKQRLEVLL